MKNPVFHTWPESSSMGEKIIQWSIQLIGESRTNIFIDREVEEWMINPLTWTTQLCRDSWVVCKKWIQVVFWISTYSLLQNFLQKWFVHQNPYQILFWLWFIHFHEIIESELPIALDQEFGLKISSLILQRCVNRKTTSNEHDEWGLSADIILG